MSAIAKAARDAAGKVFGRNVAQVELPALPKPTAHSAAEWEQMKGEAASNIDVIKRTGDDRHRLEYEHKRLALATEKAAQQSQYESWLRGARDRWRQAEMNALNRVIYDYTLQGVGQHARTLLASPNPSLENLERCYLEALADAEATGPDRPRLIADANERAALLAERIRELSLTTP
jgi:hypothetical protein